MTTDADRQKIVIFTRHFEIFGDLSIYEGVRLTDYMNESKAFISVTNAYVKDRTGKRLLNADFLNVRKDEIEIIIPEASIRPETA